jgi:hypothetical protein
MPVDIAANRYHQGIAPLIIVTGGVNRHNGIIEGRAFQQLLRDRGVPEEAIRVEDRSANTWQNVELATPYLREAIDRDLPLVAVSKWYHRRSIHALRTHLPDLGSLYAIGWDPRMAGNPTPRRRWRDPGRHPTRGSLELTGRVGYPGRRSRPVRSPVAAPRPCSGRRHRGCSRSGR